MKPWDQPSFPDGRVGALLHINLAIEHLTQLGSCLLIGREKFDKCLCCDFMLAGDQYLRLYGCKYSYVLLLVDKHIADKDKGNSVTVCFGGQEFILFCLRVKTVFSWNMNLKLSSQDLIPETSVLEAFLTCICSSQQN